MQKIHGFLQHPSKLSPLAVTYLDVFEKALDPQVRHEQAIVSLNENRIRVGFSSEGKKIDCSTPEKEYEQGLFTTISTFQFSKWRQEYCKYWNYAPEKLELIDKFEQEIIKRFEHYQLSVIESPRRLPNVREREHAKFSSHLL